METETVVRITGILTNNGILNTDITGPTTVEYSGTDQTVAIPNPATNRYYNLILSGTGTKTLPNSELTIFGDITVQSSANALINNTLIANQNLTVNEGSKVEIAPTGNLTVIGTLTNDAQSAGLLLRSDATGTASLIHNTPEVMATVERFVNGDSWHFMYSPLSAVPTTTYTSEGGYTNYNLYRYNEIPADYWNTTENFGVTGWTAAYTNPTMPENSGYIFNRYGMADKTYSQTGGVLAAQDEEFAVSYTKNSGAIGNDVTQGWTNFDGWNLLGNPFTAAIDWDDVPKTDIEAGVYVYDGDNYQYYISGSGSSPWDLGITLNGGSNIIPAGQGFWVKVVNTDATHTGALTIPANARLHHDQAFWKGATPVANNTLKLKLCQGAFSDETAVRTLPDATSDFDANFDARKMFSWNKTRPQVFCLTPDNLQTLAVNTLTDFADTANVDLGIFIGTAGTHRISVSELNFDGQQLFLEDKLLGTLSNLRTSPEYEFSAAAGTFTDRFALHFYPNHAPVAQQHPDETAAEDGNFSLNLTGIFSDIDPTDVLNIEFTQLPEWISANGFTLTGTPSNAQVGTYTIVMRATDLAGAVTYMQFTITVENTNDAPVVNQSVENQTAQVGSLFEFTLPEHIFTDPDLAYGDSLTLSANCPQWLEFNSATGTFSGIPTTEAKERIKLTATDRSGVSESTSIEIITENAPVNIAETERNFGVSPNPTSGVFKVETGAETISKIRLSDVSGKIVMQSQDAISTAVIDLSTYPDGIYFIEIETDKTIRKEKIVKK